jgi:hypothetical protein
MLYDLHSNVRSVEYTSCDIGHETNTVFGEGNDGSSCSVGGTCFFLISEFTNLVRAELWLSSQSDLRLSKGSIY